MEIIATTKITNRDGIKAIKNGQKFNKFSDIPTPKKPSWLKVKAEFNTIFIKLKNRFRANNFTQFVRKRIVLISVSVGLQEQLLLC